MSTVRSEQRAIAAVRPFLFTVFFLSGANGLVFELLFRRLLHLSLGVTHYSVGIVLSVFMAGLGIGGLFFGRIADRSRRLLLLFGLLEIGIGLLGLVLIGISGYLDSMYVSFSASMGNPESQGLFIKTCLAGLFLLPLTILMGGTLPVLGKALSRPSGKFGAPLGLLYGINTLGGVAGTLGVSFALLGTLGAARTMLLFSLISIFIGFLSIVFQKMTGEKESDLRSTVPSVDDPKKTLPSAPLLAFVVAGFVGLSVEVYWTRILAYVIGSHGYAFGIILASFLSGLGLGSVAFSRIADRVRQPVRWLGIIQLLIGLFIVITSVLLFSVRGLAGRLTAGTGGSWGLFLFVQMLILFFILVLPTMLMGAVFPFVMTVVSGPREKLGSAVGRAYSLNTAGSILGAFLGSFVLVQSVGISSSLKISILLSMASGVALILIGRGRARTVAVIGGVACIAVVFILPLGKPLQQLGPDERLVFYEEASSATVTVREDAEGGRMLSINGLDEVPVDPSSLLTFRVLAHMPLLLHPKPQEVMVLSFGGGVTTGSVASHAVTAIDAVELCPPVVRAAALFEPWNGGVLQDPRLSVIIQDGRNYLLLTDKHYDVITADATHPWSADSWLLYTEEFYELVLSRLENDGIFCQWVPLHYLSSQDFKCILRTMRTGFPRLSIWYTGSYIVVTGSRDATTVDVDKITRRMKRPEVKEDLAAVGIRSPLELFSLYLLSDEDIDRFVGEGPLNTDDRAFLEHSAARCFGRETTPGNLQLLKAARGDVLEFLSGAVEELEPAAAERLSLLATARGLMISSRIDTYLGDFSKSIAQYRAALGLVPGDGISRIFLDDAVKSLAAQTANEGDELRRKGQIDEAIDVYRMALSLDPTQPRAHNGIGLLLYNEGLYGEALAHYDIALHRMQYQLQLRYNRVLVLLKLDSIDQAREEIAVIEELEKDTNTNYSSELKKYLVQTKLKR